MHIAELIVFAFPDNLSAENSNCLRPLLECMLVAQQAIGEGKDYIINGNLVRIFFFFIIPFLNIATGETSQAITYLTILTFINRQLSSIDNLHPNSPESHQSSL